MAKVFVIVSVFFVGSVFGGYESSHGSHGYEVEEVQKEHVPILSYYNDNNKHGQYTYSFKGGNGIEQFEQGKGGHTATGSYSYYSPEGKHVSVSYTAGKEGFKVLHMTPQLEQPAQRPDQHHMHNGWAHSTYHVEPVKSAASYYSGSSHESFGATGGSDGGYHAGKY